MRIKEKLKYTFIVLCGLTWAFHIWMAHEKGDWDNAWRYSQMGLEMMCCFLGYLYASELINNSELKQQLKELIDGK